MFLMYMIDLHNHRLQNTLQVAANPLNDDRESFNMKHVDKIDEYSSASTANNVVDENLKGLINDMAIKINIDVCEDKLEDFFFNLPLIRGMYLVFINHLVYQVHWYLL